nr:putative late blight resistance protein homolog R1A-4 isoform X1 [Ipomoea trifida]
MSAKQIQAEQHDYGNENMAVIEEGTRQFSLIHDSQVLMKMRNRGLQLLSKVADEPFLSIAESQFAFSPYSLSVCIRQKLHGLFHQAIKASMKEFFRWFKGSQFYGVVVCLPVREAMSSDRRRLPLRLSVFKCVRSVWNNVEVDQNMMVESPFPDDFVSPPVVLSPRVQDPPLDDSNHGLANLA